MPIDVVDQYTIFFFTTLAFTFISFFFQEQPYKITLKIIAGTCWLFLGLTQFVVGDPSLILTPVFALTFIVFAIIFYFSTTLDWKADHSYGKKRRMGKFD